MHVSLKSRWVSHRFCSGTVHFNIPHNVFFPSQYMCIPHAEALNTGLLSQVFSPDFPFFCFGLPCDPSSDHLREPRKLCSCSPFNSWHFRNYNLGVTMVFLFFLLLFEGFFLYSGSFYLSNCHSKIFKVISLISISVRHCLYFGN